MIARRTLKKNTITYNNLKDNPRRSQINKNSDFYTQIRQFGTLAAHWIGIAAIKTLRCFRRCFENVEAFFPSEVIIPGGRTLCDDTDSEYDSYYEEEEEDGSESDSESEEDMRNKAVIKEAFEDLLSSVQ